jgi:hypothetical protein
MFYFRKTLKITQIRNQVETIKEYDRLKRLEKNNSIAIYESSIFLHQKNQMIFIYEYCEVNFLLKKKQYIL